MYDGSRVGIRQCSLWQILTALLWRSGTGVSSLSALEHDSHQTLDDDAVQQCLRADREDMLKEARLGLGEQLDSILEPDETTSAVVSKRLEGIRRIVHPAKVMAVIKDHEDDIEDWARLVTQTAHPPEYLGVSFGHEAFAIRKGGVHNTNILIMYAGAEKPEKCEKLADANIEIAVTSMAWLKECKQHSRRLPRVHVLVDTGYGYFGVLGSQATAVMQSALEQGFQVAGIMSHLCCSGWGVPLQCALMKAGKHAAKVRKMHSTQKQRIHHSVGELMSVWRRHAPSSHQKPLVHVSASGPITQGDSSVYFDMVRPGRILLQNSWDKKEKERTLQEYGLLPEDAPSARLKDRRKQKQLMRSRSLTETAHTSDTSLFGGAMIEKTSHRNVKIMITSEMEKTLPAGWCLGYYCKNEQGHIDVFDRPKRIGIPHFLVKGHAVAEVDQITRCAEHSSGRDLPILDKGPYGIVLDLTTASPSSPLAVVCAMYR